MSEENNMKFESGSIEELILALCIKDSMFFTKVKAHLSTKGNKSYFNDIKLQKIFNLLGLFFDKYKKIPNIETLKALLEKVEKDQTVLVYTKALIDKVYTSSSTELDESAIADDALSFIKKAKAYEAIIKSQGEISKGNFDTLPELMQEAVAINFDKDLGSSFKDVKNNIEKMEKLTTEKTVSTGFSALDACIGDGGAGAKTINIVAAISGGFKSGFLGNIAVNAMMEGKNVMYYTFETAEEKLFGRMYAQATRMTAKEQILKSSELADKIEASKITGDIRVLERGARTFSSQDISNHLKELKAYNNFVPDLIVVDYLMIMLSNNRKQPSEEGSFEYYKNVTEELRNIAYEFGVPVWSAVQLNRGAYSERGGSKNTITAADVAASVGIVNTSDFYCAFSQSEQDKENGKLYLGVIKSRNEGNGTKILFDVDYEHYTMREKGVVKSGANKKLTITA